MTCCICMIWGSLIKSSKWQLILYICVSIFLEVNFPEKRVSVTLFACYCLFITISWKRCINILSSEDCRKSIDFWKLNYFTKTNILWMSTFKMKRIWAYHSYEVLQHNSQGLEYNSQLFPQNTILSVFSSK